jgi:NADPH:quinone reductase-like Zn-dependent oxidoreductase
LIQSEIAHTPPGRLPRDTLTPLIDGRMIKLRGCGVERLGGRVKLLELTGPVAGPGQIVVAVASAGVGAWDPLLPGADWDVGLRPPAAMGVEGAGVVVAIGAGVAEFTVGDAVLAHEAPLPGGSGFWAERVLVTAAHAARRPPHLDIAAAGALPVSGLTARQAVDALGLESGARVLVTGGGGTTGSLTVQVAALAGLAVTTTASPSSAEWLLSVGATDVIDYHDADWRAVVERGFDAAVVSAPGTAADAVRCVRDGGRIVALVSDRLVEQRGISATTLYVRPDAQQLADLAQTLADGRITLEPTVTSLEQGPDVFARVVDGRAAGTKFVLQP